MDSNHKKALIEQLEKLDDAATLSDIQNATSAFFKEKLWVSAIGRVVFSCSLASAALTLLLITNAFGIGSNLSFDIIAYAAWTILPPAWFMLEYVWLFPAEARFDAHLLSDLKYKHELAGKIWGGLVLLITATMYLKYGKGIFDA
jgi:hypothetical protein